MIKQVLTNHTSVKRTHPRRGRREVEAPCEGAHRGNARRHGRGRQEVPLGRIYLCSRRQRHGARAGTKSSSGKCHGGRWLFVIVLSLILFSEYLPCKYPIIDDSSRTQTAVILLDLPSTVKVRPRFRHPPSGLRDGRQRLRVARHESFKGGGSRN